MNSPASAGLQRPGERRTRQLRCGFFGPQAGDTLEDQRMWGPRGIPFDPKFTWQILLGLGYSERVKTNKRNWGGHRVTVVYGSNVDNYL